MSNIEIHIPDIGGGEVEVIEILVAVGDQVSIEQPLVTLESDKASMDVPATHEGVVSAISIKVGDTVSEGTLVLTLESAAESAEAPKAEPETNAAPAVAEASASKGNTVDIVVPDMADPAEVAVIEVMVSAGEQVTLDQPLISLESDKAAMDVPAPQAGVIASISVSEGDKVKPGDVIGQMTVSGAESAPAAETPANPAPPAAPEQPAPAEAAAPVAVTAPPTANLNSPTQKLDDKRGHASPSVRKFARELGVNVALVAPSGRKGRVLKQDIQDFVKKAMESVASPYGGAAAGGVQGGAGIPPIPAVDFSKFGEIERVEMGRINKVSAANLHRAWLNVPHVTHHDEADITEVEAFRKGLKAEGEKRGTRLSTLAFHMKALVATLKAFPKFNSSLSPEGDALIYKKYYHIGIAVDTPNGLVVPVLRDVDKKGIWDLADEMGDMAKRAREKKLKPDEMQGACMSISSLGGIGGTAFTPIVNAPEVAILGITRAQMKPVWNGSEFVPRLMCPLDLSYDHKVIDGADAARFMVHYVNTISDVRRILL